MRNVWVMFRREMAGYFATPLAYIFIVIFLGFAAALAFFLGNFFERGQADLAPFFQFHPWLFVVLVPAVAMRLWAEEIRQGTMELLLTLPVSIPQAVLAKFLAAWVFCGIALALTFPMWITVNYLGNPDNGAILAGYLGSFLMAGGYLAIGAFLSALTKNQVIAFVLGVTICFLLTVSGSPLVLSAFEGWAGQAVVDFVASLSFIVNFQDIMRGVLDLRDMVYFLSLIALFLIANMFAVARFRGA